MVRRVPRGEKTPQIAAYRGPQQRGGEKCGLRSIPMENDTKSSGGPANLHISRGFVAKAAKRHPGDLGFPASGFRSQERKHSITRAGEWDLRTVTRDLKPAACDLCPATCDLRPGTFLLALCIVDRSRKPVRYAG